MSSTNNSILTTILVLSALSFVPYYYFLGMERLRVTSPKHVRVFFFVWLLIFTFEFYFLGPYSFIELSHEGNATAPLNYFLAHDYDGGRFSHRFSGGVDIYGMLPGMQYFNPELLLEYLFTINKNSCLLVGTWENATWAIHFYEKFGFVLLIIFNIGKKESRKITIYENLLCK